MPHAVGLAQRADEGGELGELGFKEGASGVQRPGAGAVVQVGNGGFEVSDLGAEGEVFSEEAGGFGFEVADADGLDRVRSADC